MLARWTLALQPCPSPLFLERVLHFCPGWSRLLPQVARTLRVWDPRSASHGLSIAFFRALVIDSVWKVLDLHVSHPGYLLKQKFNSLIVPYFAAPPLQAWVSGQINVA